jgi:NAD(P)-dependent dehydrogenase (short-subunit alcohol dehydrogenase family)
MLDGKVALVTGAASGIGRATALLFARNGARVVAADLADTGAVVADIHTAGGSAIAVQVDVTRDEACSAMVEQALAAYGRLDVAFNNAGIVGSLSRTADQGLCNWQRVIAVNLTGVFNCMVHELRAMREGGGGAIVNTASVAGLEAAPGAAAYSASKHGVIGLSRTAASEYAKDRIRINVLCPGYVATAMTHGPASVFSDLQLEGLLRRTAMRRFCDPIEQAEMVLWLVSDRASYVTGAHFVVDGGMSA